MVNYNKSTIYKLCCNNLEIKEIYIGSTTNFNKRRNAHKSDCNNKEKRSYNLYVYQFIRSNGGFQNWSMVEIELFNARDKKNLHRRERYWIETEKSVLNQIRAYATEEEKKDDNKKTALKYYYNNKAEQIGCECGSIISRHGLTRHKKTKKHIKLLEQQ
jgi:hypothetical protein